MKKKIRAERNNNGFVYRDENNKRWQGTKCPTCWIKINKEKNPYKYDPYKSRVYSKRQRATLRRKQWEADYRAKDRIAASFRAMKSKYFKEFGPEIGQVMSLLFLCKHKLKGSDVDHLLDKIS